jgi:hypothetical protein
MISQQEAANFIADTLQGQLPKEWTVAVVRLIEVPRAIEFSARSPITEIKINCTLGKFKNLKQPFLIKWAKQNAALILAKAKELEKDYHKIFPTKPLNLCNAEERFKKRASSGKRYRDAESLGQMNLFANNGGDR